MAEYAVLKSFYNSTVWRKFRQMIIAERGSVCQGCGKIISNPIDCILHHTTELTPENYTDPFISLDSEKILILCHDCHDRIHSRFGYKPTCNVCIVYGPPFAGKKTYVRQSLHRGDIVVDMDMLYAAVSGLPYYDKPDSLLRNVAGLHNVLIDNIKTRYGKWESAWVIGGYADKYKRERLATDLGAELIYIKASKEECLERLAVDQDRQYRRDEWQGYIEKWFERYVE